MLLIGGFTIASALSKTAIDRVLITRILSLAGERPSTVLLAFMGVACFASMWISNVAAPTLCFTLIQVWQMRLLSKLWLTTARCSPSYEHCRRSRPSLHVLL